MNVKTNLIISTLLTISLASCGTAEVSQSNELPNDSSMIDDNDSEVSPTESEVISSDVVSESTSSETVSESIENPYDFVDLNFDFSKAGVGVASTKKMSALASYSPTTFDKSTYKTTTTSLGEGVDLVVATFKLNNGNTITPNCVVVDLSKANIVAGCYNNSTSLSDYYKKATPYEAAVAYERDNPSKKVIASTNADFFGTYPCNAFVKDGIILKNSHHQDSTDYPVSKPMLFGVSESGAKIDAMTHYSNYDENVAASLTTSGVVLIDKDGNNKGTHLFNKESFLSKDAIGIISTSTTKKSFLAGSKVFKYMKLQKDLCRGTEVRGCLVEEVTEGTSVKNTDPDNFGYICFGSNFAGYTLELGDYFSTLENTIMSPDGTWNYYTTIIGARHSIIENGQIAATVSQETSNGCKARTPHSSVGILADGKVVIVSIEDLHYGGKASTCTGVTLSELADFMRYFGCYDAANFDGGGSSQLITKNGLNGLGSFVVRTKSSDTGSTDPSSSRKVVNTIMVTTK